MEPVIYHGTPLTPRARNDWQGRFWAKVDKNGPNGCWVWTAARNLGGYGRFALGFGNSQRMATHVMLELCGRPRPSESSQALHHCDNPSCVNPDHLYWGGYSENVRDKMARRRCAPEKRRGIRNGMHTVPEARLKGARNPAAKLNDAAVLSIIADTRPNKAIAADHGVTSSLVGQIKRGKAWRHLTVGGGDA